MRHARSIVKLRAFQAALRDRKETARRNKRVETLNSLNRWARLEVIEHDSAGVAVCEEVDAVVQRFAILRQVRWMLRQNGYDAPDLTGPEVSRRVPRARQGGRGFREGNHGGVQADGGRGTKARGTMMIPAAPRESG